MSHRDWHLPVASLQALDTRERRTLEILLKRRCYRVRLLRRQKAKLKLLFVVDEVTRSFPNCVSYFKMFFHAMYYTKSKSIFSAEKSYHSSKEFDILSSP